MPPIACRCCVSTKQTASSSSQISDCWMRTRSLSSFSMFAADCAAPNSRAAIQRSRDTGGNRPLCRVLDYAELATARWQFGSARYCGRHRVTLHNFGTRRGRPRKRYRRSQAIVGCAASGCLWVTRLATNQAPGHAPLATRESSTADDGKIMWSTVAIFVAVSRAIRRLSQRTIHNRKLCIMAVMQSYA